MGFTMMFLYIYIKFTYYPLLSLLPLLWLTSFWFPANLPTASCLLSAVPCPLCDSVSSVRVVYKT